MLVNRHIYRITEGEGVERFTDQMKPPKMVTNTHKSNPNGYFFFGSSGGLSGKRRIFWLSESIFTSINGVQSKGKVADLAPNNTLIHSAELEETTDGAVDISDVITQLRHIVGLYELTGLHKAAADNDTNGTIEISDVISSLRQIVGLQDAPNARIVDAEGNHQFMFDQRVADLYLVAPGDADLSWNPLNLI